MNQELNKILLGFPAEIRAEVASIPENGGMLSARQCAGICLQLSISIEELMLQLLPLAAIYSQSMISSFQVGSVVLGAKKDSAGMANLYLGANLEFPGEALCYTVHAEQAAVSNAWLNGETDINAIAVNWMPCGFCRQFLMEVVADKSLKVILPSDKTSLTQLLPGAFVPTDLGVKKLLMESVNDPTHLKLLDENKDELVDLALQAANLSYAPYTKNFGGCALRTTSGKTFSGRYAENAAFNPTLLPFPAALSKMILSGTDVETELIERVVLVESKTNISQKNVTQNQMDAYIDGIRLEYFSVLSDKH